MFVLSAFCPQTERAELVNTLSETHEIVYITRDQMNELCGNVLEVHGEPYSKRIMCMSTRAYNVCTQHSGFRAGLGVLWDGAFLSPSCRSAGGRRFS